MSGQAHALPRARRKRRKPPGPGFRRALGWVLFNAAFLLLDLIRVASGHTYVLIFASLQAVCLAYWWPTFRREWERWRSDNE
jgi:hypothetical protein